MRLLTFALLNLAASGCIFGQTYTITTVAGTGAKGGGPTAPALASLLDDPVAVAVDSSGNFYISDSGNYRICEVSNGVLTTVLGSYQGEQLPPGPEPGAHSESIAVDSAGNVYAPDDAAQVVWKISNGVETAIAGTYATPGFSGDGGPAVAAQLHSPTGVALDSAGNIYIADWMNYRVRKISNGAITTVAGTGVSGFGGDGGPATSAELSSPWGVAVDSAGNLFITDGSNIREVSNGVITTVASVPLAILEGIAVDSAGNLYVADTYSSKILKVEGGVVSTIAGNGTSGYGGDGGPATAAELDQPFGVAVGPGGVVYVADSLNQRIRALTLTPPLLNTVVNSASYSQTGAPGQLQAGLAPGEIVAIFGSAMGPDVPATMQLNGAGAVSTSLAGVQALFGGVAAPIVYAQANQINAVVPYELAGSSTAQVQVVYMGQTSDTLTLPVYVAAPGIFTLNQAGAGSAAVLNEDGTLNSSGNPAAPASTVTVFATGEGQTTPAGIDGQLDPAPAPKPVQGVAATIGGASAAVLSASGIPGAVAGLLQVQLQVPASLAAGSAPIVLTIGGIPSPSGVTLAVQ